ncbi:minor capsid protein [Streptococcus mitis]|uniref:minor capsid protein n=1 Tax=Streptococcus mitis TaxID=28037 RepID=UPI0022B7D247|nr:minor capsid protein [Streptococcus mitis]
MSRKLNKEEKIAFIESLDDLNREEKDRLLYELAQIDDLSEIIDYIDNLYHRTLKRITGRLEAFERVSKNRSDSLPFYLLSLTKTDQLKTKQEIAGFVKKHPDLTEWSRSIKVKTNADALFAGVEMDIAEMTGKINKRIETHLKQTYQETYLNRAYNYHKQTKREPNFKPERLEEEYIQKAINENFKGKQFSERVWGSNMDELVSRVESLVTNDLNRGYPIDQSSKLLAIEFERARNRAVTVLQTETNGIQAQATLDEYQDDNIKKYRYLATLEVHTCPICGELDGKVFPVKDAEKGVNYPTMHPHCRCTTVPALEKGGKRYARDIETGKGYEVESGQTFKDWRKQQLDKYGQTAIKDKLQAERLEKDRVRRTKEQFTAYRQVLGPQNMPKTFAGFYDLKYNDVEGYKELKDRIRWAKSKFPTEKSLNGHFKDHGEEFGDITIEEYQKMASDLLSKPTSDKILGYQTELRRVRYDIDNNIYVLGNPKVHKINTMFKPDLGREYYDGEITKDLGN